MELGGDNELWLALVMLELADKRTLQPQELAAILGATLDERVRYANPDPDPSPSPSPEPDHSHPWGHS